MVETLLIVHIVAAAAWIGGGLLNGYLGPRMAQAGGETALNWMRAAIASATSYFIPAGTLTLLSGIGLVVVDEAYDWSAAFVWIGIAVVVLALGLVSSVLAPSAKKALEAAEKGDFPNVGPNARRAGLTGRAILVLLVLAEITMVTRLGG